MNETITWIPVNERLPERFANVLAFVPSHSPEQIFRGWVEDGRWCSTDNFFREAVTHWAELP